ncbi:hypothetical protein ACK3SF_00500 [Candidatus Nanosalina sp. VS9-1]|uniref:hypothetical protein n=1 Tax=Candidatus Nanosalina sp. VS9-1 TaxID=3388566 RepID=UPI0039DF2B70
MDFKLFGRLKDDDDSNSQSGNSSSQSQQQQSISQVGGGNLKRTVKGMFKQGYDEDQIRNELQGQYSSDDINRAINNVVTSSATGDSNSGGPEPMSPYQGDDEAVSPMDEGYNQEDQNQNQGQNQQMQQQTQQSSGNQQNQPQLQTGENTVDPQIEELIETIIAENFQKVETEFQNVYSELDMIEEKLEELDSRVHDLEVRDDEDQKEFVQKMDEVEDHIDSYESRIGGLEKAFQQILPSLVDNIRDLTGLVQEIKREQGIETDSSVSNQEVDDIDMDAFRSE